jgi:hypothetical protein
MEATASRTAAGGEASDAATGLATSTSYDFEAITTKKDQLWRAR